MRLKKIITTLMIATIVLTSNKSVLASNIEPNHNKEESVIDVRVPDDEIAQLEKDLGLKNNGVYEPNNSIETSYLYRNTKKISCGGSSEPFGHYNCFYTTTYIESEDDLDFFKINLQTGMDYVAVLKDVAMTRIADIRLYFQKPDGSWWYKYASSKYNGNTFFHFTADYNTYYIRISGTAAPGYNWQVDNHWFAVERDGTIDERLLPYDAKPPHALQ